MFSSCEMSIRERQHDLLLSKANAFIKSVTFVLAAIS